MGESFEKSGRAALAGRYDRNIGTVTAEEQRLLKQKSVCVIGCGGLGGGIIEGLTRLGVGMLTIVDGDVFEASNLNRQVLSSEENLGHSKAEEGAAQMKRLNSDVTVRPLHMRLDETNCREIIAGHDVAVDALDNVQARLVLEDACEAENIPLVHGAIAGWNGQAAVAMPGSRMLHRLYQGSDRQDGQEEVHCEKDGADGSYQDGGRGIEQETGNPVFTPAVVSGIQTAEVLKLLLGKEDALKGKLLMIDLLYHQYELIDFGDFGE